MKVRCKKNSMEDFSDTHLEALGFSRNYLPNIKFGNEYTVYALCYSDSYLTVLIADSYRNPTFYPIELFDISCDKLENDWRIVFLTPHTSSVKCDSVIIGYKTFAENVKHYEELLLAEGEARYIFSCFYEKYENPPPIPENEWWREYDEEGNKIKE